MKSTVMGAALVAVGLVLGQAAFAGGSFLSDNPDESKYDWAAEVLYEPCMNGEVSATGKFSSQLAEDKAMARISLLGQTP